MSYLRLTEGRTPLLAGGGPERPTWRPTGPTTWPPSTGNARKSTHAGSTRTRAPPADAAEECGYSARQLHRYIRKGRLHNFGSEDRYLVRRCDLPRKPRGLASDGRGAHLSADALFSSLE